MYKEQVLSSLPLIRFTTQNKEPSRKNFLNQFRTSVPKQPKIKIFNLKQTSELRTSNKKPIKIPYNQYQLLQTQQQTVQQTPSTNPTKTNMQKSLQQTIYNKP